MTKRVLFLISDTGGGHRAGAQAVGAALDEIDGATRFEWRIDDIATHCTFPLSKLGPAYSAALRYAPPIYGALFHATNGRRRYRTIVRFCEPLYRERLREVFTQYQPDVIVSVHPLLNHAALRARADAGMQHVPIVTVITDLGRVHEGWLLPEADLTVVPAREVYQRALERGVPPERLRLLGHPIHPRFEDVSATKSELRKKLGLPLDRTICLLMAGGEGGGKLLPTTMGLAKAGLDYHLVVVTGRNAALKAKLQELAPSLPTPMTVLGFRNDVPELMRAADCWSPKPGRERSPKPRSPKCRSSSTTTCPGRSAATSTTSGPTASASWRSRPRRSCSRSSASCTARNASQNARAADRRRAPRLVAPHRRTDRRHRDHRPTHDPRRRLNLRSPARS